ncbi:hypothetical protein BC829DRAFT_407398 [Chytridium lagenaria]|nr:hypothetical protein BC829DRAFT_407398 [Chytridium lagenaria]
MTKSPETTHKVPMIRHQPAHTSPRPLAAEVEAVHQDHSLVSFADPFKLVPVISPTQGPKDLQAEVDLAHKDHSTVHEADPKHDGPRAHLTAKAHALLVNPYSGPRHMPPRTHAVDHSQSVGNVDVAHSGPRHLPPAHMDASTIDHSRISFADPAHDGPRAHPGLMSNSISLFYNSTKESLDFFFL